MKNNISTIGNTSTDQKKKKNSSEKRLATDYANSSGLKNTVNYKDGSVYVGGKKMNNVFIDGDNKAHVNKNEMDNAISELKDNAGIKENTYDKRIENALEDIENREAWSYDPDYDPAYQAYRDMYHREGQRAYEDAFSSMSAMTGGYESSAAVTSAAQQLNYYNSQLNDRLEDLMTASYDRYNDDLQYKRGYLSDLISLDKAQADKNNQIYKRFNEAADADRDRTIYEAYTRRMNEYKLAEAQNNLTLKENELERDNYDTSVYADKQNLKSENEAFNLTSRRAEAAIKNARIRGYFTDDEAAILGIEKSENGGYPSPFSTDIQKETEMWNTIGKEQMQNKIDYETAAAIRKAYYGA